MIMTTTVPMYLYILYLYCVFSIVILKPKPRATPRKGCATDNDDSKKPNTNYLSDYSAARNSSNDHAPKQIPARVKQYSFLKSLSQTLSRDLCDPAALRYI